MSVGDSNVCKKQVSGQSCEIHVSATPDRRFTRQRRAELDESSFAAGGPGQAMGAPALEAVMRPGSRIPTALPWRRLFSCAAALADGAQHGPALGAGMVYRRALRLSGRCHANPKHSQASAAGREARPGPRKEYET